jgi:hypothetical protein
VPEPLQRHAQLAMSKRKTRRGCWMLAPGLIAAAGGLMRRPLHEENGLAGATFQGSLNERPRDEAGSSSMRSRRPPLPGRINQESLGRGAWQDARPCQSPINCINVPSAVLCPPSGGDEPMAHKFKVGDIVAFLPTVKNRVLDLPGGVFEVIKQLPGSIEPECRIKGANESHQRIALECELTDAATIC